MKKCMCILIIAIFLIPAAVQTPSDEEEPTTVKYGQFAAQTMTNGIEDIPYPRNIGYCDSKWWWGETDDNDLLIYSAPDFTTAKTLVRTVVGDGSTVTPTAIVTRCFGANIYIIYSYHYDDGGDRYIAWAASSSSDSGSSWTDWVESGTDVDFVTVRGFDIIEHEGSGYFLGNVELAANAGRVGIIPWDTVGGTADTGWESTQNLNEVYPGVYDGADYYSFVWKDKDDATWYLVKYDIDAETFSSTAQTFTEATNIDLTKQVYWEQDNLEVLIDPDYMRLRAVGKTAWTEKPASDPPSTAVAFIWNVDQTRIEYIIWDESIWTWTKGGAIGKIQDWATDAVVGHIDWFTDGTDAYQYSLTTFFESQKVQIRSALYTAPSAQIINITEPDNDQYLILTDDSDRPLFQGYVTEYESNNVDVKWTLRDPIEIDFNRSVTVSFTDKTAHYILKYIIDNYCLFLWYDSGIDETPDTEYSPAFTDKTVLEIIRWCDATESYQTSIRPTHEVYWDEYSDAESHAVVDTTDAITSNVEILKNSQRFGRFLVYGGFLNGVRLVGEVLSDPLLDTFIDEFPNLTTQALVDAQAAKFAATKNLSIAKLRFTVVHNMIYTGQEVALTFTEYSIAAEQWYVIESNYDAVLGVNRLILTDAYWQPPAEDQ